MKKTILKICIGVISALLAVTVCLFTGFPINYSVPKSSVPMDNLKCNDFIGKLFLTHGTPDEVYKGGYDISDEIDYNYNNLEIMGKSTNCSYSSRRGRIFGASYITNYDEYDPESYFNETREYLTNNLGDDYEEKSDCAGLGDEEYYTEFIYWTGATGQIVRLSAYEEHGFIRIEWVY